MDVTYFGLQRPPFDGIPELDDVYASSEFLDAYDALRQAVERAEDFILLTGEEGAGKTLLLHQLRTTLESRNFSVLCVDGTCGPESLLVASRTVKLLSDQAYEPGEATQDLDADPVHDDVPQHRVAVLIDDAQALPASVLGHLWELFLPERISNASVSVVIASTPQLDRRLAEPEFQGLKGCLQRRVALGRVHDTEVGAYIARKLEVVGHRGLELFTEDAVRTIARHADGLPGRIDTLCRRALSFAARSNLRVVDQPVVAAVLEGLDSVDEGGAAASAIIEPTVRPEPRSREVVAARLAAAAGALAHQAKSMLAAIRNTPWHALVPWSRRSRHDRRRGLRTIHSGPVDSSAGDARVSGTSYGNTERDWLGLKIGFVAVSVIAIIGLVITLTSGPYTSTDSESGNETSAAATETDALLNAQLERDEIAIIKQQQERLEKVLQGVRQELRDSQLLVSDQRAEIESLNAQLSSGEATIAALRDARPVTVMLPKNVLLTFTAPNGEELKVSRRNADGEAIRPVAIGGRLKAEAVARLQSMSRDAKDASTVQLAKEAVEAFAPDTIAFADDARAATHASALSAGGIDQGDSSARAVTESPPGTPSTMVAGTDANNQPETPQPAQSNPGALAGSAQAAEFAAAEAATQSAKPTPETPAPAPPVATAQGSTRADDGASSSRTASRAMPFSGQPNLAAPAATANEPSIAKAPDPSPTREPHSGTDTAPVDDRSTVSARADDDGLASVASKLARLAPGSDIEVLPAAVVESSIPETTPAPGREAKPSPPAVTLQPSGQIVYEAVRGDTLSKLARDFEVKLAELRKWNELTSDNLSVGQRLVIQPKQRTQVTVRAKRPELDNELLKAARNGTLKSVDSLLKRGANIEARNEEGKTPLMLAAGGGHLQVVQRLTERGARVDARSKSGGTALSFAAWDGHHVVMSALLRRGADVDAKNRDGWTPLMYASINGHADSVRRLLAQGADVNARSNDSRTALSAAVWNGHVQAVRELLDRGASVNETTRDGWTALLNAAWNGQTRLVDLLLEYGADPTIGSASGLTPMAAATKRGHREIASTLSRTLASSSS